MFIFGFNTFCIMCSIPSEKSRTIVPSNWSVIVDTIVYILQMRIFECISTVWTLVEMKTDDPTV